MFFFHFYFEKSENGQAFYVQNQNFKNEIENKKRVISFLDHLHLK